MNNILDDPDDDFQITYCSITVYGTHDGNTHGKDTKRDSDTRNEEDNKEKLTGKTEADTNGRDVPQSEKAESLKYAHEANNLWFKIPMYVFVILTGVLACTFVFIKLLKKFDTNNSAAGL